MKYITGQLTIALLGVFLNSSGQATFSCNTDQSGYYKSSSSGTYIPDASTPVKYIKVNIHFMLKTDGTGNFRSCDDGNGNSNYTGYDYAEDLIYYANNNHYANNRQMWLLPGNSTEVLPMKIRLELEGVYFHDNNNTHYYYDSTSASGLGSTYGIANSCNVFLVESTNPDPYSWGGNATMSGLRSLRSIHCWTSYLSGIGASTRVGTLVHELGHNFGLIHPTRTAGACRDGSPYPYCDDGCTDTPTWEYLVNTLGEPDPCCWNGEEYGNNYMDYTANKQALTPCQLGIAHEEIELNIDQYKLCYMPATTNICEFPISTYFYTGENIYAPGGSCSPSTAILNAGQNVIIIL